MAKRSKVVNGTWRNSKKTYNRMHKSWLDWRLFIFFGYFFFFATSASAKVVINEFSSSTTSDWVELYNNSEINVDLSSYMLLDGSTSGNAKGLSCNLAPHGFYVVDWGRSLNKAGDVIKLKDNESLVDCVSYGDGAGNICDGASSTDLGSIGDNQYGARDKDGVGSWQIVLTDSKNNPNDGSAKDQDAACTMPSPTSSEAQTQEETGETESTYKINDVHDEAGNRLSSVKIFINGVYTHNYAPETYTFCRSCKCEKCDSSVNLKFGEFSFRLEKSGYETWTETKSINPENSYEVDPVMKALVLSSESSSKSGSTPTKTPSATVFKTKLSITPNPNEIESLDGEENNSDSFGVLGIRNEFEEKEEVERDSLEGTVENKFPIAAGLFIAAGLSFIGAAAYPFLKNRKSKYNLEGGGKNQKRTD